MDKKSKKAESSNRKNDIMNDVQNLGETGPPQKKTRKN
jgi:hypothetical protein